MSEVETTESVDNLPIELGVADGVIAGLGARLNGLKADTPAKYQMVKAGIQEVRTIRTGVERARKELKQSALEWGRKVDTEARRVTEMLLEIEQPLKKEKARIDDEKDRIKREKAEKIRLEAEAKERAEREEREKQEAAERERIRKEQEEERARLLEQKAELERRRAEQDAQIKKLEEEKAELERQKAAEQEKRDAEERKRLQSIALEKEKKLKEQEAIKAEEERKKREAEEARLAEERKPDAIKLSDFLETLRAIQVPKMSTEWGQSFACKIVDELQSLVEEMDSEL